MRTLTTQEKRTIRFAAIFIAIYLVAFFGYRAWKYVDQGRRHYLQMVADARVLRQKLQPYGDKAEALQKMMERFRLDPAKLSKDTVVAEASAALQSAAKSSGIELGPIRETQTRGAAKELAQMQFEGTGPVPAILGLLSSLESLGYPLVVDAVTITSEKNKPGMIKLTLTIQILNFEQWKQPEAPHA
jgi:hypothetical protein